MLQHGGRLHDAAATYGIPLADWLDLSAAINPQPWPAPSLPATIWHRLPDEAAHLQRAASTYYGCDQLLAVNGSQQAINALPHLRARGTVMLFEPGYEEHAVNWRAAGHRVDTAPIEQRNTVLAAIAAGTRAAPDVLLLINPHNPTGDVLDPTVGIALQQRLAEHGGWLLIDEAFADGAAAPSAIQDAMPDGLIVLRSTGKFFGLPGLRGGFVFAAPELLTRLAGHIGPWPQSTAVQYLLPLAFADRDWQQIAPKRLMLASQRLRQMLATIGLPLAAGTPLFQTLHCPDATSAQLLRDNFARNGILVRHYQGSPYLRFGLPALEPEWQRLQQALNTIV